jgi:hypothetical protein
MASSFAGRNSDGLFPVGHVKVHVYALPPRNIEGLLARLEVGVAKFDVNMLRRVRENDVRPTPSALKWTEVSFNACYD